MTLPDVFNGAFELGGAIAQVFNVKAIPPAYTRHLGAQLMAAVQRRAA